MDFSSTDITSSSLELSADHSDSNRFSVDGEIAPTHETPLLRTSITRTNLSPCSSIVDWSTSGLIAVAGEKEISFTHLEDGLRVTSTMEAESENIRSVKFSRDSQKLATLLDQKTFTLFDVRRQSISSTYCFDPPTEVYQIEWNQEFVNVALSDGHLQRFDVREMTVAQYIKCHSSRILNVKFSRDGNVFATVSDRGIVRLWDVRMFEHSLLDLEHDAVVKAMGFCTADPDVLCTGGGPGDDTLRLWDTKYNGPTVRGLIREVETEGPIYDLAWSASGNELCTGHGDPFNQVSVWSHDTYFRVANLRTHGAPVISTVPNPFGTEILTLSSDGIVAIWKNGFKNIWGI